MEPNEPSHTALMAARYRAAHQVLDHGSVLHDPFAMRILGEEENEVVRAASEHPLASIGRLFAAARSRIAEDALSEAIEMGVRQTVILGAGLDTFAFRNHHSTREIRVFEVDHPATQEWKRQRLAQAELAPPPWLVFVPVDFEQDNLRDRLASAGFQKRLPAFFSWLGVVPYLTRDAIEGTLDFIASIAGSEVVFDYTEPPEAFSEEVKAYAMQRSAHLEVIGERWASRFRPSEITGLLRSHGFRGIDDLSFRQIASRFGESIHGLATGEAGVHVVHAEVQNLPY